MGVAPAAAQSVIGHARARLLGGRGPGASPQEISAHTRDRTRLAGRPVAQRRAALAAQTARMRGDPAAIADHVAATADRVDVTVAALRHRVDTAGAAVLVRAVLGAAALGAGLGFIAALVLRARLTRNR